jgi:hypothetical protein
MHTYMCGVDARTRAWHRLDAQRACLIDRRDVFLESTEARNAKAAFPDVVQQKLTLARETKSERPA